MTTGEALNGVTVSMVESARATETRDASAAGILDGIRSGRWAAPVAEVRRAYSQAAANGGDPKEAVAELKKALPGVLWSGTFERRANAGLREHSGLLCADLDGLAPARIAELKSELAGDCHVAGAFESPTGSGLKVLVRVPPQPNDAGHKLAYAAVESHFRDRYGEPVDQACKDVARLCFVSFDPGAWWRPEATELPAPATPPRSSGATVANESEATPPGCIILPSGAVSFSESAQTIFTAIAPSRTLFWRGGAMVELVETEGVASLEIVKPEAFRTRVERYGHVFAWRAGAHGEPVLKRSRMSRDDATALMATVEAREMLPPVASVVRCPVVIEGAEPGTVEVLKKGYHATGGGLLILSDARPEQMEPGDAAAALHRLVEEFAFTGPGDRARALAALVTPALRLGGWLTGPCPVDVAEADQSQAGKGFRHHLVCALYGESAYFVTSRSGGVGSTDESFAAALIAGRPFISLDNFRGRIESQHLEAFVTAPGLFPCRVPHRGEVLVNPRRFILQLTSNGLEATRDLVNRASICRIKKRPGFQYRDTLGELQAKPGRYLGAVFSLVAEWAAAGKPRTKDCRHDFREWAQTLDWFTRELLGAGPLLEGHEAAQERAANPILSWLRVVALALESEGRLGEALSATELVDFAEARGIGVPGLDAADPDRAARAVGSIMRRAFASGDQIGLDGFTVQRASRWQSGSGEGGKYEVKTYAFKKP